jgi:hypothetical protein
MGCRHCKRGVVSLCDFGKNKRTQDGQGHDGDREASAKRRCQVSDVYWGCAFYRRCMLPIVEVTCIITCNNMNHASDSIDVSDLIVETLVKNKLAALKGTLEKAFHLQGVLPVNS